MKKIGLTQGKFAIVDDKDADLALLLWHARKHGKTYYAKRNVTKDDGRQTTQNLHKIVGARMGIKGEVDHRDRDGLNCTRSNLRPANRSQNNANQGLRSDNSSGVKGVGWYKRNGTWRARIRVKGRLRHLGYFTDKTLAEAAVKTAREQAFGEFACHGE